MSEKKSNLGNVIPRCSCQNNNTVGVHWFRGSFNHKDLDKVKAFVSSFFGDFDMDDFGLWSYDKRLIWRSGVSLNYDSDLERGKRTHNGRMTLDVPGKACDELSAPDLLLFLQECSYYNCKCGRIDVFWDDYGRTVSLETLQAVIDKKDFSVFRIASKNSTLDRTVKKNNGYVYDSVTFGRRGSKGSGSYLRIYDKKLESNGESDCIRWELEFSQGKAHKVFMKLSAIEGNLDAFAAICGGLIGACITFVHRPANGEKHLNRMNVYEWWSLIVKSLGKLSVRISKKKSSLPGMLNWHESQVSPSLACIRKSFATQKDFARWIDHISDVGSSRMSKRQIQIAKINSGLLVFDWNYKYKKKSYSEYIEAICA